jgi:D-serine deaminase-like pyridoxal phosphate-dependent protein
MDLLTLETPCLVLDRRKLKKNISYINKRMENLGVNLRPHGKTAKILMSSKWLWMVNLEVLQYQL